jgi:hypothetical protein
MLKPNVGRALSAAGALLLIISLALVWYHVERPAGVETSTGWQAFPRLRFIVLGGAVITLLTAAAPQTRWVLALRTVCGLIVAALILRRIVDPPSISAPVTTQIGVYPGLIAALAVAIGGLVDTGRRVADAYPGFGLSRSPLNQLPPAPGDSGAANRVPVGAEDTSRR